MGLFNFFFSKKQVEEKPQPQSTPQPNINQTETSQPEQVQTAHEIPFTTSQAVCYPTTFTDIENLITEMRDKGQPALVNLSQLDLKIAQRYIDVLSGAVLALNGSVTALQKSVYYFHPNKK